MDRQQGKELFTLITTVRHVVNMDTGDAPSVAKYGEPGCLLCEGVRHNLYSRNEGDKLSVVTGFGKHFGCTQAEANRLIFHSYIATGYSTTGENYYQAGKELLTKYGYGDLFDDKESVKSETMAFSDIMAELKEEAVNG